MKQAVSAIPAGLKCENGKWENLLAFVPVLNCYLLLTGVNDERSQL